MHSHIRCMEHAVHLATSHFIKGLAPTLVQALIKMVKQAVQSGHIDDLDLNEINQDLEGYDGDVDEHQEDLDVSDVDFEVGDAVGKALALVTQANIIHHSM